MKRSSETSFGGYEVFLGGIVGLLERARSAAARSVNSILTLTYWEVGRRVFEQEQKGKTRSDYGALLLDQLSADLSKHFGRGFSRTNISQMRHFYLAYREKIQTASEQSGKRAIVQTVSEQFSKQPIVQTLSEQFSKRALVKAAPAKPGINQLLPVPSGKSIYAPFPLSWSHYVRLLSVDDPYARSFYEHEATRGGWSVRQLDRQISTLFYDRSLRSRKELKPSSSKAGDRLTPDEEIRDPLVLEFLGLKDEYSESELEDALIHHLEHILLELGNDLAFVARKKRLRVGDEWYRVDLLFFHRRLRCLVLVDLKLGKFTHADAGQMNLYLNYAREHWTHSGENPPVGLILCSEKNAAVAHYSLGNMRRSVLAREYQLALPGESALKKAMLQRRRAIQARIERK